MSDPRFETYHHTQSGPWWMLTASLAVVLIGVGAIAPVRPLQMILPGVGVLLLLLSAAMARLTVADEGDHLEVRFGPLGVFRKRIPYAEIVDAQSGRSNFLDGWGIHWSPWGGPLWNIWGYDCVVVRRTRGTFRIGTDDPAGLSAFLRRRIAAK